ncbi:MAG: zinc ABC transporter solute-binding protein [Coleofasciculaceae cyanobacterium RL_1_1]|nr:zinc ABC transporter solute-binding protein [Coleofasciculaceae cyanobacterium RL_1_1]
MLQHLACTSRSVLTLLATLAVAACQSTTTPTAPTTDDPDKPNIVATSTIVADLVAQVGGDAIDLQGLLEPGADPHVYEPVPADSIAIEQADFVFYSGHNLEPALVDLILGAGSGVPYLAVGEQIAPLALEKEGQRVADPHVWGDVSHAIVMVEKIRDALSELEPEQAATFATNAAVIVAELQRLDDWIPVQIMTIPEGQRAIVTTHDAFQYYASAYGLEVIGTLIGISTEEQPSAQTVRSLVEAIKTAGLPAIFAETTIAPKLIETVAEEAGVKVADPKLYSDSIGAPGSAGDSYIKMMVSNTCSIAINLGGSCTPFEP